MSRSYYLSRSTSFKSKKNYTVLWWTILVSLLICGYLLYYVTDDTTVDNELYDMNPEVFTEDQPINESKNTKTVAPKDNLDVAVQGNMEIENTPVANTEQIITESLEPSKQIAAIEEESTNSDTHSAAINALQENIVSIE